MRFRISGTNWEGRAWVLTKPLQVLGRQISDLYPDPHPTDGTVAGKAHDAVSPTSDHRPKPYSGSGTVRALDFGENTEDDVFKVLEAIRLSADPRIKYVIHESRMFSSYPVEGIVPYAWRPYGGPAPHSDHGHISTLDKYDTDTKPWQIEGVGEMPLTEKEENFVKEFLASMEAAGLATLASRRTRMDKVVEIGGNYPATPAPGSGGLTEDEVKQIIVGTQLNPP